MSDSNTIKQLRNEVQLLRDELAIMKRKYEDILYNLDTDNFSQRVVKQGKDMYTKIEQTAGEISLQAEKVGENTKNLAKLSITAKEIQSAVFEENEDGTKTSRITQTAEAIRSEVQSAIDGVNDDTDEKLKSYSTITQTAEKIESIVTKQYVTNLIGDDYVTDASLTLKLEQSANGIYSEVSERYETKSDANSSYNSLSGYISSVSQEAGQIESRVEDLETFKTSTFSQTADGFTLDGEKTTFTGVIYLTDDDNNRRFSIFHTTSSGLVDTGEERVLLHSCDDNKYIKYIVIGDGTYNNHNVYIAGENDNCLVATQGWVLENAGSGAGGYAVFG